MPPSLQTEAEQFTIWDDHLVTKRSTVRFTDATKITFSGGASSDPIRIANIANPTDNTDAATKQYVDSMASGLTVKGPVRVVAMSPVDLATACAEGATLDGITLAFGNRILLAAQTAAVENGVYTVAASGPPSRTVDFPIGYGASGSYVFVDEGTMYADRSFVCTSNRGQDVVGTDALEFVQFGARPSAMAGLGLVVGAANELDVNVDGSTLNIIGDVVSIKESGVTNVHIAPSTIANDKLVSNDVTVNTDRGLLGGQAVPLGTAMTVQVDHTVIPDLLNPNTFTAVNTFSDATAATSQTTGALVVTGGVGISGDVFCNSTYNMSDERLKADVTPILNALEIVDKMRGCTFTWNDHVANEGRVGKPTVGVIAQEVQTAGAELCVIDNPDELLAVDYCKLVPYLIEAVKTLKRKFDDMEHA